jgi:uncharacterized protein (TIGR02117 family)
VALGPVDFSIAPRYSGKVGSSRLIRQSGASAILAALLLCLACASPLAEPAFRGPVAKIASVVNYGWHSSIVLKRAEISPRVLAEIRDFPDADYLEFGWGDWDYYQAADPGVGLALKAAFGSSGSVLHVTGIKGAPGAYFPGSEIVEIPLSEEAFQRMIAFLASTFARPYAGAPAEARPGLDPRSKFYRANGRFHLFRTCNTWVAEALREAGLPVSSFTLTAGGLMNQVKPLGVVKKGN